MKKIVSIVLALVMVLSLTACSGSASGTTAAGNDKETQAAAGTNETAEPVEIVAIAKSIATSSWQLFGTAAKQQRLNWATRWSLPLMELLPLQHWKSL